MTVKSAGRLVCDTRSGLIGSYSFPPDWREGGPIYCILEEGREPAMRERVETDTGDAYRELLSLEGSVDVGMALCVESPHLEDDLATFFVSGRRVISLVQLADLIISVRRGVYA